MKITPKGIGWLIFGVIVCASATESIGLIPALSTIALGLVFILIYVMKQFFKPRGLGWYIVGGMMAAFSIESGANSDTLIALAIAFGSLLWFYYRNKDALDYMFSGVTSDEIGDFSYVDEDTYPEPDIYETIETVETEIIDDEATEADSTDILDTDISVSETVKETAAPTKTKSEKSKPALQTYPPEGPEEPIIEFELSDSKGRTK